MVLLLFNNCFILYCRGLQNKLIEIICPFIKLDKDLRNITVGMDPELEAEARSGLVVLPKVSDKTQDLSPAIQATLGSNKSAKMLASNNFNGIFVRLPQQSVVKTDSQGEEVREKFSLGCIYIPAPNFDRIVVIKTVSDISRSKSLSIVGESVQNQMTYLNDLLSRFKVNSTSSSQKVSLQFFITSPAKVTRSKEYEQFKSSLLSIHKSNSLQMSQIETNMEFIGEKQIESELKEHLKKSIAPKGDCSEIVNYFANRDKSSGYKLKTKKLKILNSEPSTFYDVDSVIKLFEFFFPDRLEKFYTVPELNQLEENMLYCTNEEGELGKLADYGTYMGEVDLFSKQLLSQSGLSGVFLKSFSNKHLESIVDSNFLKPENFEFDWVYLGSDKIVVFEVGLSQTPSEPWRMIENKISQSLTKHIPHMQVILHSFQKAFGKDNAFDSDLTTKILNEELIFCVYFPEMEEEVFIKEVEQIKNSLTSNVQVNHDKEFLTRKSF